MTTRAPDPREFGGLTEAEAAARLERDGPNEIAADVPKGLLRAIFDVVREPMLLLLLAAGGLYLVLGDVREALTLLAFVFVVIAITLYQERKTAHALTALRNLSSPRALVLRDGLERRIPGREVARGDLLVLAEGDRVPADGTTLDAVSLEVDESLLTGESVPVRKRVGTEDGALDAAGGEDSSTVFSGTLVVRGRGLVRVRATGAATELGKIGKALATTEGTRTPLQLEIGTLVRRVTVGGVAICVLLVVVYGATRGDWIAGLLAGITLQMAVLPEEFPVVLTVFFALGAWRMSRHNVLTRQAAAIEALGAATVLCVDKTGTLTDNRMTIARLSADDVDVAAIERRTEPLPEEVHELLEFGILASQRDPFDPMEIAFHELGRRLLADTEHLHDDWVLEREYPLSPELLSISHVFRAPEGGGWLIAAKGSPEAIFDLCHLSEDEIARLAARVEAMAAGGLRVLAVARARFDHPTLPAEQHDFAFELLGLVGLRDPVRAQVPEAVAACHRAGIRVVMITGDHVATARAIAADVGLDASTALTGPELGALDDDELARRAAETSVVARAVPDQKLRLVKAFMARGDVVAMTGDGVNDAPALRAAHIGIAMGRRGTDVAREAASLVLTDDDFSSIVAAVRTGRRIFQNLRKAVVYILAIHVPIAGASLVPALLGWPLLLLPAHVVFLELVIDPACSVAFEAEPEEPELMRRPPRRLGEPMLGRPLLLAAIAQGTSALIAVLLIYGTALGRGVAPEAARALAFAALIAANLALIFTNRSWSEGPLAVVRRRNTPALVVTLGACAFLAVTLAVQPVRELFHFSAVAPLSAVLAVGAGAASVLWFELVKRRWVGR